MPFESETGSAPGTDSEPVGEIESELPVGSEAEPEAEPDPLPQPEPAEQPLLVQTDGLPVRARATRVRLRSAIFGGRPTTSPDPGPVHEEPVGPDPGPDPAPEPAPGVDPAADDDELASMATHGRRRRFGRQHHGASAAPVRSAHPSAGGRLTGAVTRALRTLLAVVLIIVVMMGSVWGLALGINAFARWNARRIAAAQNAPATATSQNLLIIGVRDGAAIGFTALKVERDTKRVLGIAIPEGAFVEVPGQGFERIGASYNSGPAVSEATVSNYFGVQFTKYVVIGGDAYQALLQDQNIGAITDKIVSTDLSASERSSLVAFLKGTAARDVWLVPLPLKAMTAGTERYFEPQRTQVADLLLKWWGVRADQQKTRPRVIVYNGVGTPGLASVGAQQLIRAGFQVVDSGNADHFGYTTTTILVYHAPTEAQAVRAALGVGTVQMQSAPQEITDMIVILGADYLPPVSVPSSVPTQGAP